MWSNVQRRSRPFAFEHGKLLSEGEDLESDIASIAKEDPEGGLMGVPLLLLCRTQEEPRGLPLNLTHLGHQQERDRIVVVVEDLAVRHRALRKRCGQRPHFGVIAVDQAPFHERFHIAGITDTG